MDRLNKEDIYNNLFKTKSSKMALRDAMKEIFSKGNRISSSVILFVSLSLSIWVSMADGTVNIAAGIIDILLNVVLAIFGIVFTGYSIFQAIMDKDLLINLFSIRDKTGNTQYVTIHNYFLNVLLLNTVCISLSVIYLIVIKIVPVDLTVFNSVIISNVIFSVLFSIYVFFALLLTYEIKSLVYNVYQLFNISAGFQVKEHLENMEDEGK